MKLHTAVRSAVVLISALGAVAAAPTGAAAGPPAQSAVHAARPTAATTAPWSFIRRACRTFTAGTVCVNLEGNGQPSTYRVVYQLQPKPGQWMQPLSTALWHAGGNYTGVGDHAQYTPFCTTTCARVTRATDYVVLSPYYAVYTMIADTPAGHVDVSAGVTPRDTVVELGQCGASPAVSAFLTSTSDGTVYLARDGGASDVEYVFSLSDVTPTSGRQFFRHYFSPGGHPQSYGSPTFYTGWQRFYSKGTWTTQVTFSSADGNVSYGGGSC